MTPERWRRIEDLCHAALERDRTLRGAFLHEACAGDEELQREVESLLAQEGQIGSFLEASPLEDLAAQEAQAAIPFGSDSAESPNGAQEASLVGRQLGSFQILSLVGKGGMGEVYRAHDAKLGRDVAVKILPGAFAGDPERLARFRREARLLASLNHPNIAAIYGMEESQGLHCLVMELVPGETLAERFSTGGPVPVGETLRIAVQIAEALEAAHEKNIVHRDLKLANVNVTAEGKVKVLDFGLAKAFSPAGAEVDLSAGAVPTISAAGTEDGLILGTPAYMSPEQARGKPVDTRTDIWAFGCVLYELLSGKHAFHGETLSDTIAAVLEREPDWHALPPSTPARVHELLRRCLQKDARRRLQAIGDARIQIEEMVSAGPAVALPDASHIRSPRLAWIVASITTLAFASVSVLYFHQRPVAEPAEMRVEISTPSTPAPLEFALSPDGRSLVFVASGNGPQRLWLRALDKTDARPMPGTEGAGAQRPFWSPDGRSIGFFNFAKLYRVDVIGGRPQVLANAPNQGGGTWNAEGTILFAPTGASPIMRVGITGGEPVAVTQLDPPRQIGHREPQFLPDGRHFLFYARGTPDSSGIYLASLDGGQAKRLVDADTAGMYLRPDHVIFGRQGVLLAQRLNLARGELTGDPVIIANPVAYGVGNQHGFSVSRDGRIAYRAGDAGSAKQLVWFDGTGKTMGAAAEQVPVTDTQFHAELSPDERRIAISQTVQGNRDLWLLDVGRSGKTRLTFDPANEQGPMWSPDGKWIAFSSNRKGLFDLYVKASSGAGTEELLLETPNNKGPLQWSKDGQFLLYFELNPRTGRDLWVLPMSGAREAQGREAAASGNASPARSASATARSLNDGRSQQELRGEERRPRVVVNTPFEERNGQFSPDGRWLAYETNDSGMFQIVVQPFPEPTGKWQVSINGGVQPRWRADGKELYFIAPDGKLMSVPVNAADSSFKAGTPVALFQTRIAGGGAETLRPQYSVSRDGRFLINQLVETSTTPPITLILNWKPKP